MLIRIWIPRPTKTILASIYGSEYALEAVCFCKWVSGWMSEWVSDENRGFTSQTPYEEPRRAVCGGRWQIRDFIIPIFGLAISIFRSAGPVQRSRQTAHLGPRRAWRGWSQGANGSLNTINIVLPSQYGCNSFAQHMYFVFSIAKIHSSKIQSWCVVYGGNEAEQKPNTDLQQLRHLSECCSSLSTNLCSQIVDHHLPSATDDPAGSGGGTNQELRRRPKPKQWPASLWLAAPHQMKLCNTQSKVAGVTFELRKIHLI